MAKHQCIGILDIVGCTFALNDDDRAETLVSFLRASLTSRSLIAPGCSTVQ